MKKVYDRKCLNCKTKFTPTGNTHVVCNYLCAIEYSKKNTDKIKAKIWKEEKAVLKDKLKTLGQYEAEAKKSFQRYVRLRDKGKKCISCGKITDEMDGGHFKKAEIYSGVIFNEMNCHSQCRKCNRFQNGNELNYRLGLIERYGLEYATKIELLANETRIYKYTKDELIAKKLKYDILIKEMK